MSYSIPQYKELPINHLSPGRYQPRRDFDELTLAELAASIAKQGIIEPLIVRPTTIDHYEIIAGERRWRAAQLIGLQIVPCLVSNYTDEEAAAVTLIENIQRENLNPIEEAMAYRQLMEEFQYTHDEIASSVGKSRTKITNMLRLLKLDSRIQQWIIEKRLSEGHGKILAALPQLKQFFFAEKCLEQGWSVRKIEEEIKNYGVCNLTTAPSADANLLRLERLVSEHIGTEVKLDNHQESQKGWLKIKYHDYEILNGILEKIGVTLNKVD